MATQKTYIITPENKEQDSALKAFIKALKIKFEVSKDDSYNPDFIAKVKESEAEYKTGKYTTLNSDEIDNYLGLK